MAERAIEPGCYARVHDSWFGVVGCRIVRVIRNSERNIHLLEEALEWIAPEEAHQ